MARCCCPMLLFIRLIQLFFTLIVLGGTSTIVYKLAQARQENDTYDILGPPYVEIVNDMLATPKRIYLGLFVSVWSVLVLLYLIISGCVSQGKYAPRAAIITLEILTTIFWLCGAIALALFAAEVEEICTLLDAFPILKTLAENCVIVMVSTGCAGLSWILWSITFITVCIQAVAARRRAKKTRFPATAPVMGTQGAGGISQV